MTARRKRLTLRQPLLPPVMLPKTAQNAATQQATQAAQSKDAADKLMQQAKTYADEAAGYAGAAKYSFRLYH